MLEPTANGTSMVSSMSPAALLKEQHTRDDSHKVTVEEVPDEYDIQHPSPSLPVGQAPVESPKPGPSAPEAAAPVEKPPPEEVSSAPHTKPAPQKAPVFDVRSEELFPALGGAPNSRTPAAVPMAWGARKSAGRNPSPANGLSNGGQLPSHLSSNASSRTPTPASGLATPSSMSASFGGSIGGPKTMTMPGKHVERIRFAPSQMLPRNQLKKPIRDILRDTSRRFKAVVDMYNGPGESIIFEGKGSVDAVRQALKEVAQQVGSKVWF